MDPQYPLQDTSVSESSRLTGAQSNALPTVTQLQCRHQLVHRDAANAATKNMTQDTHLHMVRNTGSRKNIDQYASGCE